MIDKKNTFVYLVNFVQFLAGRSFVLTINALSLTKFEKIITTNHPHLLSAGDDRKFA